MWYGTQLELKLNFSKLQIIDGFRCLCSVYTVHRHNAVNNIFYVVNVGHSRMSYDGRFMCQKNE